MDDKTETCIAGRGTRLEVLAADVPIVEALAALKIRCGPGLGVGPRHVASRAVRRSNAAGGIGSHSHSCCGQKRYQDFTSTPAVSGAMAQSAPGSQWIAREATCGGRRARTRTWDPLLRRQMLSPAELRAHRLLHSRPVPIQTRMEDRCVHLASTNPRPDCRTSRQQAAPTTPDQKAISAALQAAENIGLQPAMDPRRRRQVVRNHARPGSGRRACAQWPSLRSWRAPQARCICGA